MRLLRAIVVSGVLLCPAGVSAARRPKLVVLIVVDQLAALYVTQWGDVLDGGFRRLRRRGAYYSNGVYAYANTETAPGHATIATGAWPNVHGMVANHWIDLETGQRTNCVEDAAHGKSPALLAAPGIADALKLATRGRAKVVAVGVKDRGAILLGGQHPTFAAWYDAKLGSFVAGTWSDKSAPPAWFSRLILERLTADAFGGAWDRFRPDLDYRALAGEDDRPTESDLPGLGRTFPRRMGVGLEGPDEAWRSVYSATPHALDTTMLLAQRAVTEERLGRNGTTDLLAVAVSSLDYAGHWWGSHSQEALDFLLRIDAALLALIEHVDRELGEGEALFVVTGDHGVLMTPEEAALMGVRARRVDSKRLAAAADRVLAEAKGAPAIRVAEINAPRLFFSPGPVDDRRRALRRAVASALAREPGIRQAFAIDDVHRFTEPFRALFERSTFPGRDPDILFLHGPDDYVDEVDAAGLGMGTGHGSPYAYDMTVPIFIAGPRVRRAHDPRPYEMTRLAPTLAALMGIVPPASALAAPLPAAAP